MVFFSGVLFISCFFSLLFNCIVFFVCFEFLFPFLGFLGFFPRVFLFLFSVIKPSVVFAMAKVTFLGRPFAGETKHTVQSTKAFWTQEHHLFSGLG